MTRSRWRQPTVAAMLLVIAAAAHADPLPGKHPLLNKRFMIGGGGFFPSIDSQIRFDSKRLDLGTQIDFEDELGLEESKTTFWITSRWRISRRNNLEFEFSRLNRDAVVGRTTREYQIGDTVVRAGALIDSVFDIDLYRLTYGYSLIRSDEAEVQLQAGLHVADLRAELLAIGVLSIDGQPFADSATVIGDAVTAPLPHFGGNFTFAFSEKFGAYLHVIGFALEVGDIDGSIVEAGATLQYNFTDRIGVGAGVRYFNVDVTDEDEDRRDQYEFSYLGPVLYANFSF